MKTCPICSGLLSLLGSLGRLWWYRCRNCGHEAYILRRTK